MHKHSDLTVELKVEIDLRGCVELLIYFPRLQESSAVDGLGESSIECLHVRILNVGFDLFIRGQEATGGFVRHGTEEGAPKSCDRVT